MDWQPISHPDLRKLIDGAQARMSPTQRKIWSAIRIPPQKWQLPPWGAEGNGFWVVAIVGQSVLWYNDIEDGFNCSRYDEYGVIADYWCNQDDLEHAVQQIARAIETGAW